MNNNCLSVGERKAALPSGEKFAKIVELIG
jgi:hypothetical protein